MCEGCRIKLRMEECEQAISNLKLLVQCESDRYSLQLELNAVANATDARIGAIEAFNQLMDATLKAQGVKIEFAEWTRKRISGEGDHDLGSLEGLFRQ